MTYALIDNPLAITPADADHTFPISGALVALEDSEPAEKMVWLRDCSVTFRGDIIETAVGRFTMALEPDGSEFLIH